MTSIRGLSLGNVGPYSRPPWPHQTAALSSNSGPASPLLSACLSLAGPERGAEAHGPSLSWPAQCQGSASTGMYGQDGTLHFNNTGNRNNKDHYVCQAEFVDYSSAESVCALKPEPKLLEAED